MGEITAELVRSLLAYDQETGVFTWISAPSPQVKTGQVAGTISRGYLTIKIDRRRYKAHRVAWLYVTGEWPAYEIDHINGVRADNRFCNLRVATKSENMRNRRTQKNNTSGLKGVCFSKARGRYVAHIRLQGKLHYLGCFDAPEEAHAAYVAAARELHGEFARSR